MGLIAMIVGGVQMMQASRGSTVEVITDSSQVITTNGGMVVDVAQAVGQPGVYSLIEGDRVADALGKAGGLTDDADLEWVVKMINQAQMVSDGMKIYIPFIGEVSQETGAVGVDETENQVAGIVSVNINTAGKDELKGLWGIGETRAEAIIGNRPYSSVDELKDKAGVPLSVIDRNKEVMGVY